MFRCYTARCDIEICYIVLCFIAKLELALKRARGPCDECEARQTEMKSLQDNERQMNDRVCSLEHLLENEKQTRKQLENYKDSLEQSLNSVAVEMRTQVIELVTSSAFGSFSYCLPGNVLISLRLQK